MKNSYASETPVTDGQRVYVYLAYVGLFAYDMDGALVWAKPMDAKNTGSEGYFYRGAASPALHERRIYIVNDNEEPSFAAAFDTSTGAELWRVARDERSNWSTPYVWRNDLRTEIITVGSRKVRSYDVNGTLLWELAVGTTLHTPTPFARHGILKERLHNGRHPGIAGAKHRDEPNVWIRCRPVGRHRGAPST